MKISAKYTEVILYVSLQTKAMYAASEQQYTAAGGDVQVPTGCYLPCVWRKAERQEIDTRIGKANAVLRELYRSVATKRELSNTAKLSDQGWANSGPRNMSATAFSVARGSIQEILQI